MWNQLKRVFTKLTKGSSRADDAALLKLFYATDGDSWTRLDGWTQRDGLGGRFGVITNGDGRVVSLDLRSNNLCGELPEELGNLQMLQELYLAENQLRGGIPTELGDLQAVKIISLSSNALTGEIPKDFGSLPRLESLLLQDNRLTGGVPKQLGDLQSVKKIDISRNRLTGGIPRQLCDLPFLEVLYLQVNQLSGGIPKALGNLRCIKKLDLSENLLSGTIPAVLGNLRATQGLLLQKNQFHGKIPKEIGYLRSLVTADLSGNKLSGEIPKELGNLAKLEVLHLHDNKLSGGIPAELGKLRAMKRLRLWKNFLKGGIPKKLGDLQEVYLLDLSNNQLTGEIPEELGNLAKLDQLYLDGNDLTGGIPKKIGDLQAVKILDLSGNSLSGEIPQELGHLPRLQELHLQGNKLRGPIPEALGSLQHLTDLNVMNNDITGPLPDKLRKHRNFPNFKTGLPLDGGPPLPDISSKGSKRILLLPVVLGYLDLVTDLYTAGTYYSDGHNYWFALVLLFSIAPTFIVAAFFLPHESRRSKIRVVTHTCLVYEAYMSTVMASYSPTLALLRVVEPLFESLPQAFLQLYAMLLVWDGTSSSRGNLLSRSLSVSFSIICLAYAATDLCSAESLATFEGNPINGDSSETCTQRLTGVCSKIIPECLTNCLTFMSSFIAPSRNMKGGKIELAGFGRISKDSYVGLCFVYHVVEIVSRFVSLALVAVAIHERIFLLLAIFFAIRCVILRWVSTLSSPCLRPPVGSQRDRQTRGCSTSPRRLLAILYGIGVSISEISLRVKVRLVATPFLDSILEGERAFKVRLGVTLVEFIACLIASAQLQHDSDALPSTIRSIFAYIAVGSMVAKMVLAWWLILPLKAGRCQAAVAEQCAGTNSHEQAVVTHAIVVEQPATNIRSDQARLNRAAFGDWSVENIGGETALTSHAAFHEQLIAITSSEEAGTGQATVTKQPAIIYSSEEAIEIGQPSGVQRRTTDS